MPRPKQFLREDRNSQKKSKHGPVIPQTADEYLAVGVDFEEAGEKWRGGDVIKSMRFFGRAVDCYDEALRKFPTSFDLAYNKARVQYEVTQYPKLLMQVSTSLLDLLSQALESSRYALSLLPTNADALFNTAQILTSIVEALEVTHQASSSDPLSLLEEALALFQRCLAVQEVSASLQQEETTAISSQDDAIDDDDEGGVLLGDTSSDTSSVPQDDRWATIVEPVTNDTLLDTVLAQLETLTTIAHLLPPHLPQTLTTVQSHAATILDARFDKFLSSTDRAVEALVTRANFFSAFADAQYRLDSIDATTYYQKLEAAYQEINVSTYPKGLVEAAESLVTFNSSLRSSSHGQVPNIRTLQWKALSKALDHFTAASKLPDAENLEKIHMARGDSELLRFQLGQGDPVYPPATSNAAILLKNAGKFYRGAQAVAKALSLQDVMQEGTVKEALAMALGGTSEQMQQLVASEVGKMREILSEALEDGLFTMDQLKHTGVDGL